LVKQKPDLGRAWGRGGWEEKGRRFKKKIGSKVNRFWETASQKKQRKTRWKEKVKSYEESSKEKRNREESRKHTENPRESLTPQQTTLFHSHTHTHTHTHTCLVANFPPNTPFPLRSFRPPSFRQHPRTPESPDKNPSQHHRPRRYCSNGCIKYDQVAMAGSKVRI